MRALGLSVLFATLVLPGCGSSEKAGPRVAPAAGGASAGGAATGGAGGVPGADASTSAGGAGAGDASTDVFVEDVSGRFLDQDGLPPPEGFGASVCGPVCYISQTTADGSFVVPIGSPIPLSDYSALPHGRPLVAGFYFSLPEDQKGPHLALGDLPLVNLPAAGAPIDLAGTAPQSLKSGPATLIIPAGTETKLEFDDIAAGDQGSQFRAVLVEPSRFGSWVPAGSVAAFALGPFESYQAAADGTTVPTRLAFDNTAKLSPGTSVDVLALGTYLHPSWIPPGRFAKVASAVVASDGKTVELSPGDGLLYLTWAALVPTGGT
ncbi:MAG TPA: hypothetical protein VHE30_12690 [Polyangiaceae bacterium]|nr:hypothetical protein [Polyangiaceae bacterium]